MVMTLLDEFIEQNKKEIQIYQETEMYGRIDFVREIAKLREQLDHALELINDMVFNEFNDDVELGARFLKKNEYCDYDEEKEQYIAKHKGSTFTEEKDKGFYLSKQRIQEIESQVSKKEKIIKEAIKNLKSVAFYDGERFKENLEPDECTELLKILEGE